MLINIDISIICGKIIHYCYRYMTVMGLEVSAADDLSYLCMNIYSIIRFVNDTISHQSG